MTDTTAANGADAARSNRPVALVTGASKGIGAAVALELAKRGFQIVAVARATKALEALDDAIEAATGHKATLVPLDMKAPNGLDQLAAALAQRYGRLDALAACAGILGDLTPAAEARPRIWDDVMAVNLTANYRLIRAMDPLLRAAPAGRAAFLTSGITQRPRAFWATYAASKAGLEALVACYAQEVAFTGVRVNLFNPGPIRTAMRAKAFPGEDPATLATPEDVAPAIADLLRPEEDRTGARVDFSALG